VKTKTHMMSDKEVIKMTRFTTQYQNYGAELLGYVNYAALLEDGYIWQYDSGVIRAKLDMR